MAFENVRKFAAGEVSTRVETLFELWNEIKKELKSMSDEIEKKKTCSSQGGLANTTSVGSDPNDDPEEVLATQLVEEDEQIFDEQEGRI